MFIDINFHGVVRVEFTDAKTIFPPNQVPSKIAILTITTNSCAIDFVLFSDGVDFPLGVIFNDEVGYKPYMPKVQSIYVHGVKKITTESCDGKGTSWSQVIFSLDNGQDFKVALFNDKNMVIETREVYNGEQEKAA